MEMMLNTLLSPTVTFSKIKQKPKMALGFVVLLSAWSNFFLALFLLFKFSFSATGLISLLLALSFLCLLLLIFKTMWIHFVSELIGGEGKISSLFLLFCMGNLPLHFTLPVTQVGQFISPAFTILAWILLFGWSENLHFKAIQENYQLSQAKTWLVIFSPTLLFLVFIFAMVFLLFASLMGLFLSFGSAIKSLPF